MRRFRRCRGCRRRARPAACLNFQAAFCPKLQEALNCTCKRFHMPKHRLACRRSGSIQLASGIRPNGTPAAMIASRASRPEGGTSTASNRARRRRRRSPPDTPTRRAGSLVSASYRQSSGVRRCGLPHGHRRRRPTRRPSPPAGSPARSASRCCESNGTTGKCPFRPGGSRW